MGGTPTVRRGMIGALVIGSFGFAAVASAQPVDPPPAGDAPATPVTEPARPTPPPPPDAAQISRRVEEALSSRPGGLRAEEVARRSEMSSPEVRAKQKAVEAAAAKVDQAALMFIPQFTLTARYVRLSPIDAANLSEGGSLLGSDVAPGQPVPIVCPPGATAANQCFARAQGVELSFPVLLNMWTLQGSVGIPLSDYLLRLTQNHAAASRSRRAAEVQQDAARVNVKHDARVAFYNWVRAKGGLVVAEQGLATANAHLRDVKVAEQVGSASRADLLAVEGQVASTELLVENTKNMAALSEEQLRTMMHDPPGTQYSLGEDVTSSVPKAPPMQLQGLFAEAMRQRLEPKVIDETVRSLRETRKVVTASTYPRLDAFGNLYHSNPNTRVFPQEEKWATTWDVGVQMTWKINDTFTTGAQVDELDASILQIEAQRAQLEDGIRLQVTNAYNILRNADFALETTQRQLKASEESYRVRRELFRAGRATSSELSDAEVALTKALFDALNARIDVRVARASLDHVLGRDAARP